MSRQGRHYWFFIICLPTCWLCGQSLDAAGDVVVTSPDGQVTARISIVSDGRLQYGISRGGKTVLEPSPLGITVDAVDLGREAASISGTAPSESNSSYPTRGVKSLAQNHYTEVALAAQRNAPGDSALAMTWRAYNDGIAFRYQVPGSGERVISGESTGWTVPSGTTLWLQSRRSGYQNLCTPFQAGGPQTVSGPPVVCKLPDGDGVAGGYAAIAEGGLRDWPGLRINHTAGACAMTANLSQEASWKVPGGTWTPWRIVVTGEDLDELVNSTLVTNVSPPPAASLANAAWIRPGRALWSWWAHRDGNWEARYEDQTRYIDGAASLGFEYVVWENGWTRWAEQGHDTDALLRHARDKGIGVWLSVRWSPIDDENPRADFLNWVTSKNNEVGANVIRGLKIETAASETQAGGRWVEQVLSETAAHGLMVSFHGIGRPAGESRTWPNEMTREATRGLKYHLWGDYLPPSHNAALPFTRGLTGHTDYTPVTFTAQHLGQTTFAHQLAMALAITSPLTTWADDPAVYLLSPARDVIQAVPTCWDETVVLDPSEIGELAVLARRSEARWFLAVVNGDAASEKTIAVNLSFLQPGAYQAVLLSDSPTTPAGLIRTAPMVSASDTLNIWLRPGGGCVGMFVHAQ